jgi:transcriptional regulator with XRE-family HTH domain
MDRPLPARCVALRALRLRRGASVAALARLSGVSPGVLYNYERGATVPSRAELDRLAAALGSSPAAVDPILSGLDEGAARPSLPRSPLDPTPDEEAALDLRLADLGRDFAERSRRWAADAARQAAAAAARERAAAIWEGLRELAAGPRAALLAAEPGLVDWSLVELLCERSVDAAADTAERAVELAGLAVQAALLAPGEPAWCARMEGWARFFLANARRVQGRLDRARAEMDRARERWRAGEAVDPFPFAEWRLLDLEASLLRDGGHFEESLARLEQALGRAPATVMGRILLKKAFTLEQKGEAEEALAVLGAAEARIDPRAEPRQAWAVAFNRVVNLCHLSRFSEARSLLPTLDSEAQRLGGELDQLRLLWLSGRVAAGLGDLSAARTAICRVRQELADRGIDYDFAVVSLDLAGLLLERGELAAVRRLPAELTPILKRQKLHRQARTAVAFFCRAVVQEKATAALARKVATFLRRAERSPGLCFEE